MTCQTRIHRIVLLAIAAVLMFSTATTSAAETLTMKFEKGETYGYLIKQEMKVAGQVQGQEVQTEMNQTMSISTHVSDVNDGSAKAAQTINRVQMKMVLPPPLSKTVEYDTASEEEPSDPIVQQVAANLGKMVGEAISMTISPQGKMSDIEIPEALKQSQQAAGGGMGGGQLEQMLQQSGMHLPDKPVEKGDSWDQSIEIEMPFGKMTTKTTYTYDGQDDDGLHKISAEMDINLTPAENAPMKVTANAKEATGSFLFDNSAGKLKSSEIKQTLEMDIGGIAKQNISTVVSMTLTDGETSESDDGDRAESQN